MMNHNIAHLSTLSNDLYESPVLPFCHRQVTQMQQQHQRSIISLLYSEYYFTELVGIGQKCKICIFCWFLSFENSLGYLSCRLQAA